MRLTQIIYQGRYLWETRQNISINLDYDLFFLKRSRWEISGGNKMKNAFF